jgi:hypothetical protein
MKKSLPLLIALSISTYSFAAEKKVEKKETVKAEKKVDKADELITNRRFRASNGSLSNFSFNTQISYNGGSLDKPFSADRPNISSAGDVTSVAGIVGTINGSYRINKLNRINVGTGVQMLAPFNDSIDTDSADAEEEFKDNRGVLDVSNPYASYTHMNKFFGVQTIATAGLTQYTASRDTNLGYQNDVNFALNTMYAVGKTGFSFGALALYTKFFFEDDTYTDKQKKSQADIVWGFLPQAEYIINDTFNIRTIIRTNWYQNTTFDQDFSQRPITQSVGLGISVNRDVFLYPNIQFAHSNLQAGITNIGFTANINMF